MAEPLKNLYDKRLINSVSREIKKTNARFDSAGFQKKIFCNNWKKKELKERMRFIASTLHEFLPQDFEKAISILMPVSEVFNGFEFMFFPDFVELYGLDDFELSMRALAHFTEYSSSEFAVRPFIKKYPLKTMEVMLEWAESENEHLRRLASEGCRPRLPWACALPQFKKDPALPLKIIKKLLNDESEYVRRSAANNLNDISKDNPLPVLNLTKQWLGKNKNTNRLLKHGCRTLLKSGNAEALALFGYNDPGHVSVGNLKVSKSVKMGQYLDLSFTLKTDEKNLGLLRIEYALDFKKSNGRLSRKIFKISESDYRVNKKIITKTHSFKPITTRKYYPGVHGLAIIINGRVLTFSWFNLESQK